MDRLVANTEFTEDVWREVYETPFPVSPGYDAALRTCQVPGVPESLLSSPHP